MTDAMLPSRSTTVRYVVSPASGPPSLGSQLAVSGSMVAARCARVDLIHHGVHRHLDRSGISDVIEPGPGRQVCGPPFQREAYPRRPAPCWPTDRTPSMERRSPNRARRTASRSKREPPAGTAARSSSRPCGAPRPAGRSRRSASGQRGAGWVGGHDPRSPPQRLSDLATKPSQISCCSISA